MAKPSITFWNRVEPSARSDSLVRGLEAAVRDPLWFLARQWQMGEFQGEDAGSPSTVSVQARQSAFIDWRVGGGQAQAFDGAAPLEALVQREDVTPSWSLAVELGQALERLLRKHGASGTTIVLFRDAYRVPVPAELTLGQRRDEALVRFLRICGGRSTDGLAALDGFRISGNAVPASIGVPAGAQETAAGNALRDLQSLVDSNIGSVGKADAPAWSPERLDYDVEFGVQSPQGETARLQAVAGPNGGFDWYAFDEHGRGDRLEADPELLKFSLFPTTVNFSGMPNSRWWQFEDANFNWTDVDTDRREIAKAMVLDFMLIQGNDWFLIPIGQKVGSLVAISQLLVRDVFGKYTLVRRAGSDARSERWTMFSTEVRTAAGMTIADYFVLSPSALRTTLDGPDLEEVRFLRDEQANLVWGIEARTENGIGRGWPGHERALTFAEETGPLPPTASPLRYRLQTEAPIHWIPFPPVQVDATRRAVALERASLLRTIDGVLVPVEPVGRVLNPTNLADAGLYRINEEEVTRSGTRILRGARRTRWLDGTTHAWVSRRRRAGLGEGNSGLRYDIAEQTGADVLEPDE